MPKTNNKSFGVSEEEKKHFNRLSRYFNSSRLGYDLFLWGAKHFGYYPSGKNDISEKKAQELMQDLIAQNLQIKKNQLILDAGCGQGVVSTYLAKKYGCKIIGITMLPFEIKKANKLAENLAIKSKVKYYLMDYSNTTFKNNQFDAIYTIESFVHSLDSKKTLREFLRILKPGGKIAMFEYTLADDKKLTAWERKIMDTIIKCTAAASLKKLRHDSFPKTLRKIGFESVKEQNITKNFLPSLGRFYRLAKVPYFLVKLFSLQKFFINLTIANEPYKAAKKDLWRYCIFTANKPKK